MWLVNKNLADLNGGAGGGLQGGAGGGTGITNPLGGSITTIQALIAKILQLIAQVGLPIVVIMIIYAGFLYVTARGNEEQVKRAHKALLYTVIGAAIVLGAWVISRAVCQTVNQLGANNACSLN